VYPGHGVGYARSTSEELRFIAKVAASTGIVLDPVYSGKALFNLANIAACQTEVFMPGQRVLFLHTGGTLGLYDKAAELLPLLPQGQVTRMEV
jgi:1-aminocyclopropane-1-carboxylate deaminase/D-cysteine desulfhydrase-like pyridoxal-dependent ACC family enzyme